MSRRSKKNKKGISIMDTPKKERRKPKYKVKNEPSPAKNKAGRDLEEPINKVKNGEYHYWVQGEGLIKIEEMLNNGLRDNQIAEAIGVCPQTLCDWKNRFELLNFVWKKARHVALKEVENATFKNACGYYVTEQIIDNSGKKRAVKRWISGSTGDRALLLKNWDPENYKDKREVDVSGAIPVVISGDEDIQD